MNKMCKSKFYIALYSLNNENLQMCKKYDLNFYYNYHIQTFYDLRKLKDLGVSYVRISYPLTHQMAEVNRIGVPVRAVPNIAQFDTFASGVCGSFIRPEDLSLYEENGVEVIEFEDADKRKEQALYRIYMEQGNWPGDIQYLITNLSAPATNRMIPPDFAKARLNCSQKCMSFSNCHLCQRYFDLANPTLLKPQMERN
jgi:hypothetical protein